MQHKWLQLCSIVMLGWITTAAKADDWPQWLGPKRDGVWREEGILDKFPSGGPKQLWRAELGGGFGGPAIAEGNVFVMDRLLDKGDENPADRFDDRPVRGTERVVCFDQKTGKLLWKHAYDCTYRISYPNGPRTTPAVADGKVYALGAMGDFHCLDAKSGKVVWEKHFLKDYNAVLPFWGFAASPLVDGDKVICLVGGPKDSTVVAFNKSTGKELWKALSVNAKDQGYCPPMIYEAGGKRQLIQWLPDAIYSLNPETGEQYWTQRFLVKSSLTIPTPRMADNVLFLTSFYNGSMAVSLDENKPDAEVLWKSKARGEKPNQTTDLSSIIPTPYLKDGYVYGVGSYGELRCLDLKTGKRVWSNLEVLGSKQGDRDRWNNAFLVPHGEETFLFTEKGELVIAKLTPKGYTETDRAKIMEPTYSLGRFGGRSVLWTHPAFAGKCLFARSDKEIVCVSLAAE